MLWCWLAELVCLSVFTDTTLIVNMTHLSGILSFISVTYVASHTVMLSLNTLPYLLLLYKASAFCLNGEKVKIGENKIGRWLLSLSLSGLVILHKIVLVIEMVETYIMFSTLNHSVNVNSLLLPCIS